MLWEVATGRLLREVRLPRESGVLSLTFSPDGKTIAAGSGIQGKSGAVTLFDAATLEISNTTPLPARIYANEGIAQVLFFESDEVCRVSYKDKQGKYQAQREVTLPRI